jgi:hypothetical protein
LRKFFSIPVRASLDEFIASGKDKAITAQINEMLCTNFISSLEVEDIEALANSIYKIPKICEKIADRSAGLHHLHRSTSTPRWRCWKKPPTSCSRW